MDQLILVVAAGEVRITQGIKMAAQEVAAS
jgi:hypothetical protein